MLQLEARYPSQPIERGPDPQAPCSQPVMDQTHSQASVRSPLRKRNMLNVEPERKARPSRSTVFGARWPPEPARAQTLTRTRHT